MTVQYDFVPDLSTLTLSTRTIGGQPFRLIWHRDPSGVLYLMCAPEGNITIFTCSGTNGVFASSSFTGTATITKNTGGSPRSSVFHRDTSGGLYIFAACTTDNVCRAFVCSGTDGILSSSVIGAAGLTTRAGLNSPSFIVVHRDTSGILYAIVANTGGGSVSLFACSGADGVVNTTTFGSGSTLITKTVGSSPFRVEVFRDQSGVVYAVSADSGSNRISIFACSGTDGVISSSVISSASLITKATGTGTFSAEWYRDTSGIIYIATADENSNRVSIVTCSGTDGIVSSSVISSTANITKTVSATVVYVTWFRDDNGIVYLFTADRNGNRVSIVTCSGTDGIVSSSVISAGTNIVRTVASDPFCVAPWRDTSGTLYLATAERASGRVSILPLGLVPYLLRSLVVENNSIVSGSVATLTALTDYFSFQQLVIDRPFFAGRNFRYQRDTVGTGTVISGKTLIFSTNTADIGASGGITIASGAILRLGKKAGPYDVPLTFSNGSTLEVYPDSDRGGSPLDMTNQTFTATTTINVTSGIATVMVTSASGITAGAGVTVQEPSVTVTLTNLIAGSEVRIYATGTQTELAGNEAVTGTIFAFVPTGAFDIRIFRAGYQVFRSINNPLPSASIPIQIAQLIDRGYSDAT